VLVELGRRRVRRGRRGFPGGGCFGGRGFILSGSGGLALERVAGTARAAVLDLEEVVVGQALLDVAEHATQALLQRAVGILLGGVPVGREPLPEASTDTPRR